MSDISSSANILSNLGLQATPATVGEFGMRLQDQKLHQLQQTIFSGDGKKAFDRERLEDAAQNFEAIFFQQMLDAMDKTIDREDSFLSNSEGEETFRGMMYEEIAKSMAHRPGGSGLGLADQIYRQSLQILNAEEAKTEAAKVESKQEPKAAISLTNRGGTEQSQQQQAPVSALQAADGQWIPLEGVRRAYPITPLKEIRANGGSVGRTSGITETRGTTGTTAPQSPSNGLGGV